MVGWVRRGGKGDWGQQEKPKRTETSRHRYEHNKHKKGGKDKESKKGGRNVAPAYPVVSRFKFCAIKGFQSCMLNLIVVILGDVFCMFIPWTVI